MSCLTGIEPAAVMHHDNARDNPIRKNSSGQNLTAAALHETDITVLNAARLSVLRIDPDRLPVFNRSAETGGRAVKLTMHAITALAGHKGKREFLRRCGDTFSRLEIGRMPQAVVIVIAGNLRGEELNLPGFS